MAPGVDKGMDPDSASHSTFPTDADIDTSISKADKSKTEDYDDEVRVFINILHSKLTKHKKLTN